MDNLGAHMSISGGVQNAIAEGTNVGAQVIQIFSKSSNQWAAKPLADEDVKAWLTAWEKSDIWTACVHDSYLINLASPNDELWEKSIAAFVTELERCALLRIPYLVMHPGAHMGEGEDAGVHRCADAFNKICSLTKGNPTQVLIENTAGQGTCIGYRFEHIAGILERVAESERFACCFDTCHALAGGYDFRTAEGYAEMMATWDTMIGSDRIKVFHMNDSKKDCCSRVDRHEHIGQGFVGIDAFRYLVNDKRFFDRPMCLETPKVENMDETNLATLRELRTPATQKAVEKAVKAAQTAARERRQISIKA
ncbi:MAG: deoxyribonuclease IV [bacterium]